jgi:hypothetical protein
MNDMERFRRQHEELCTKMIEIERTSLGLPNAAVASKCARLLAKMSGLLQLHLVMEDAFFYARVDRFESTVLRALCGRFESEVALFRRSFRKFVEQYSIGSAIDKDATQFQTDLLRHFDWLRRRQGREERELYQTYERSMTKKLASTPASVTA